MELLRRNLNENESRLIYVRSPHVVVHSTGLRLLGSDIGNLDLAIFSQHFGGLALFLQKHQTMGDKDLLQGEKEGIKNILIDLINIK